MVIKLGVGRQNRDVGCVQFTHLRDRAAAMRGQNRIDCRHDLAVRSLDTLDVARSDHVKRGALWRNGVAVA